MFTKSGGWDYDHVVVLIAKSLGHRVGFATASKALDEGQFHLLGSSGVHHGIPLMKKKRIRIGFRLSKSYTVKAIFEIGD